MSADTMRVDDQRPRLMRDWVGRTVRTRRELRSGMLAIPKGTVATVTYNRAGLTLSTEPCGHCGVGIYITKVPLGDVDLLLPETRTP